MIGSISSPFLSRTLSHMHRDLFVFKHQKQTVSIGWASQVALVVKNLPGCAGDARDPCVPSLGGEDPLEEGMATHSIILAWRIPMNRGAQQATVHGVSKSRTDWNNWVCMCPLEQMWEKKSHFKFIEQTLFLCLYQALCIYSQGVSVKKWIKTKQNLCLHWAYIPLKRQRMTKGLDKIKSQRGGVWGDRRW